MAARELTSADPVRVAMIAALNVADELFRARSESTGADSLLRDRTAAIERLVDEALAGAGAHIRAAVNGSLATRTAPGARCTVLGAEARSSVHNAQHDAPSTMHPARCTLLSYNHFGLSSLLCA